MAERRGIGVPELDLDLLDAQPALGQYLPGATNLTMQQVCPGRYVGHLDILSDGVAYALAMDALTHAGPASIARIEPAVCDQTAFAGADLDTGKLLVGRLNAVI